MNRTIFTCLILGTMLLAMGCSTDSRTTEGDLNDPDFVQAKSQIDLAIEQAVGAMDQAMDFSFVSPSDTIAPLRRARGTVSPVAAVDTFSYSYDAISGWHVAFAAFSDSGVTGSILDSVQYQDAFSLYQQVFDSSTTDFIWVKQSFDFATPDTGFIQADVSSYFNMSLNGLTGQTVTANGSATMMFDMVLEDQANTCSFAFDFAETVTSVQFAKPANENDGVCPTGGTVTLIGSVSIACTGDEIVTMSDSWNVTVVFNSNSTMSVTAVSENTTWTYEGTTPCGNYENPI
jgi:hypothetical protein